MATIEKETPVSLDRSEKTIIIAALDLQIKSHERAARTQMSAGRPALADAIILIKEQCEAIQRRLRP